MSEGRPHVSFDDIRHFVPEVLQHRVLLNYDGQAEDVSVTTLLGDCLAGVGEDAPSVSG